MCVRVCVRECIIGLLVTILNVRNKSSQCTSHMNVRLIRHDGFT